MIRKERNIRVLTSSVWGVNFNLISYQYVSSRGAVEHRSKVRRVGFEHGGNNEGKTKLRGLKRPHQTLGSGPSGPATSERICTFFSLSPNL